MTQTRFYEIQQRRQSINMLIQRHQLTLPRKRKETRGMIKAEEIRTRGIPNAPRQTESVAGSITSKPVSLYRRPCGKKTRKGRGGAGRLKGGRG